MMPWRAAPTLQDEKKRDTDEQDHETGEAEIDADVASSRRSLAGTIRRLFRGAMRCLTHRAPVQELKPQRRRRTEETGRGFKVAARKLLTRIFQMPVIDLYTPELWQWNNLENTNEATEEFQYTEQNHLSPHP